MTKRLTLALLAICIVAQTSPARADDYELDGSHTSVIFGISHLGMSITYGRFNKVSGEYTLDAANPSASQFKLLIATDSIDTNDAGRDRHLKSPDFLNTGEFPSITFESTKVATRQDGEHTIFDVTGNLTMHGVTKEVTLALKKLGEGAGPGGYRSGFVYEGKLLRSDYGMTNMIPNIGDDVAITISFEGVRK